MLSKRTIIIVGSVLIAIALMAVVLALLAPGKPNNSGTKSNSGSNNPSKLPHYKLSPAQEEHIRNVTELFLQGYNSYNRNDYSDLVDTQRNSTQQLQVQIQAVLDRITHDASYVNYSIRTTPTTNTFSYEYPEATTLMTTMIATVNERTITGENLAYTVKAKLRLIQDPTDWLLDGITLEKINR